MSTARFWKGETRSKVVGLEADENGFEVPDSFRRRYHAVVTEFWRLQDELRGYRRAAKNGQAVEIPEQTYIYLQLLRNTQVETIIEILSKEAQGLTNRALNGLNGDYRPGRTDDEVLADAKEAAKQARHLNLTIHVLEQATGARA